MNVREFKFCPHCGAKLDSNTCLECQRSFYSAPHPNVSAFIHDPMSGEILLVREPKPGLESKWEIPGGFVELEPPALTRGECLEMALERELVEELGQENAKVIKDNLSYLQSFGDVYREGTPIVSIYFIASVGKNALETGTHGNAEIGWFSPDDLPSFEHSCDQRAVEFALKLMGSVSRL